MTVKHHRSGPSIKDIPGELYRYYARSDTLGQPDYMIELEANDGTGECACKDFLCRCTVNIKNGLLGLHDRTCKHIRRALIHHALRDVRLHLELENRGRHTNAERYKRQVIGDWKNEFRNTGRA